MVEVSKRASGLQPVETAPKDGRYFLFAGSNFDGGWAVVHWDDGLEWWQLDDGKDFEIPLRGEGGLIGWRELPEADTKTETALLEALETLRQREVQMIGAAISTRNWHDLETAYNQGRDRLDRILTDIRCAALTGSKSA